MNKMFLGLLFLLGMACQTGPGRGSATTAEVVSATGTAEIHRADSWQSLRDGHLLSAGDQIRTGADGKLEVRFSPHGGVMSVQPDSLLQIKQIGPSGTNEQVVAVVELSRGRVIGDTLKLPKGSKVMVKTRAGSFAIP